MALRRDVYKSEGPVDIPLSRCRQAGANGGFPALGEAGRRCSQTFLSEGDEGKRNASRHHAGCICGLASCRSGSVEPRSFRGIFTRGVSAQCTGKRMDRSGTSTMSLPTARWTTLAPSFSAATCSVPCVARGRTSHGRAGGATNPPYHAPTFVLTHYEREPVVMKRGTTFFFVTGGIEEASCSHRLLLTF